MAKREMARLMAGFRRFRERYFANENSVYRRHLSEGQHPKTLVIGCSDSRVDPVILTDSGPGDLFVVRNVANLVPPFETGGGHHGTSAAIEFAVMGLKVEHIVVMGHRQCGGIRALVTGLQRDTSGFIEHWMEIARPAHFRALAAHPDSDQDTLCHYCEMESVRISIENLRTFPFVREAIAGRGLSLIGLYFDLESGEMLALNEGDGRFHAIDL